MLYREVSHAWALVKVAPKPDPVDLICHFSWANDELILLASVPWQLQGEPGNIFRTFIIIRAMTKPSRLLQDCLPVSANRDVLDPRLDDTLSKAEGLNGNFGSRRPRLRPSGP